MLKRSVLSAILHAVALMTVALTTVALTQVSSAAVWPTTQSWSPEMEQKYQAWVATSWDKNFFTRPGFYQNVLMDCADTVYAMRIIFSAQNGLPFVMKDPTGGGGKISNEMSRFDSLPQEKRLRRFLTYIFEVGSTASLPNDTYPAAVNRSAITSGSLLLSDAKSHHSWTVQHISEVGIPFLLFSSRPAKTVLFERYEYPTMEFTFPMGLKPERHAGFRNFRQPNSIGLPVYQVPGYSTEQYEIPYGSWIRTMQKRLQLSQETPAGRVNRVLQEACKGVRERVDIIRAGVAANENLGSKCMDATMYDDYSTPNRDLRMKGTFEDLAAAYNDAAGTQLPADIKAQVESVLQGEASAQDPNAYCPVEIAPGRVLTLGQVYARSVSGALSNNPHDTLEMRWGLASFPSSKARSCPVY